MTANVSESEQKTSVLPSLKRSSFPYTSCYCEENVYCFLRKMRLMQTMEQKRLAADPSFASSAQFVASQFDEMFAVFISSLQIPEDSEVACKWEASRIAICTQDLSSLAADPNWRAKVADDPFVMWDYHVIALVRRRDDRSWYVADLDTKIAPIDATLSTWLTSDLLVPFERYFSQSFFPDETRDKRFTSQNVKVLKLKAAGNIFRFVPCDKFLRTIRSDRSHMMVSSDASAPTYSKQPPPYAPIGVTEDPLLKAIIPLASSGDASSVESYPEGSSPVSTSTSKNPRLARNNLVSFINTRNKSAPGTVVGRDDVASFLASLP